MHLRITREASRGRSGDTELFYLREVPYLPGLSIQATGLTLDAVKWTAGRITGVTQLDLPRETG